MSGKDPQYPNLSRLISVPGMVALAVLGAVIVGASRLFGAEVVFREVLIEMVASFGSALLVIAVFGLFFRSGIERLIRRIPGGDLYEQSTDRLREMIEGADHGEGQADSRLEERLDRIEESLGNLSGEDLPRLRDEIQKLRGLLESAEPDRET
ncbi:hypothetical protein BH18ACT10_BH18ACT10_08330 [soil metagenome]